MQELIKYFEAIEARLASLEAAEQSLRDKEQMLQAWEERLQILEKAQQEHMAKLQAVGTHVTAMLQMLKQLEAKPKVEEPKVEEPRVEEVTPKASIYGKAVTEIRQAISIGDRFLYQRELFEQNAELMQRTLNELDQLNSFSEAMDYINMHFHWNQESNTYQQFIVTLHRRFG